MSNKKNIPIILTIPRWFSSSTTTTVRRSSRSISSTSRGTSAGSLVRSYSTVRGGGFNFQVSTLLSSSNVAMDQGTTSLPYRYRQESYGRRSLLGWSSSLSSSPLSSSPLSSSLFSLLLLNLRTQPQGSDKDKIFLFSTGRMNGGTGHDRNVTSASGSSNGRGDDNNNNEDDDTDTDDDDDDEEAEMDYSIYYRIEANNAARPGHATQLTVIGPDLDGILASMTVALAVRGCSLVELHAAKSVDTASIHRWYPTTTTTTTTTTASTEPTRNTDEDQPPIPMIHDVFHVVERRTGLPFADEDLEPLAASLLQSLKSPMGILGGTTMTTTTLSSSSSVAATLQHQQQQRRRRQDGKTMDPTTTSMADAIHQDKESQIKIIKSTDKMTNP